MFRVTLLVVGVALCLTVADTKAQQIQNKKAGPVVQKGQPPKNPATVIQNLKGPLAANPPAPNNQPAAAAQLNGQAGDQGEKQNGQAGNQGEQQNGQAGNQGEQQNGQAGNQGEKQNGQQVQSNPHTVKKGP